MVKYNARMQGVFPESMTEAEMEIYFAKLADDYTPPSYVQIPSELYDIYKETLEKEAN